MLEQVLLAAIIAGLVATLVTVLIERYGGLVGGALGTVPSTIIPAVIGMSLAQENADLMASLSVVPLGMLANAIFLSVWIYFPEMIPNLSSSKGLVATIFVSLLIWSLVGTSAILAVDEARNSLSAQEIAIAGVALTAVLGLSLGWKPRATPPGTKKVSKSMLITRGLMAATAIGISVWIANLGYSLVAGLASVFPAIFLTSMVALWISQEASVPRGAAAPMLLGGGSVGVYALLAMTTLDEFGLYTGSLVAWVVSVSCWSLPAYGYLRWRRSIVSEN